MRSGNGRHRRPRQVPAVVVAAGVTGSALAMPLLAATGANAADAPTWDRVAQCESGGTWSTNSGNGAYGGLQMTQELWEQYGGRTYAPRPDLASRQQQIAVADKVLNANGTGNWQACGTSAGLAKDGKAPDVNPGSTKEPSYDAPAPRAPEHAPSAPTTGGSAPSDSTASPAAPASPSANPDAKNPGTRNPDAKPSSGTPSPSTSGKPDGGKHRKDPGGPTGGPTGDPTEIPTPGTPSTQPPANPPSGTRPTDPAQPDSPSTEAPESGSGAGSGKHRAEPPRSDDGDRASRGDDARAGKPGADDYTVRPGDNLSVIAEAHSVNGGWHSLYQRNEKVVGSDPDLILPGQRLEVGK